MRVLREVVMQLFGPSHSCGSALVPIIVGKDRRGRPNRVRLACARCGEQVGGELRYGVTRLVDSAIVVGLASVFGIGVVELAGWFLG